MILKQKLNHNNESVPKSQDRKKCKSSSIKCEGFAHSFLRLQWHGASCIHPCHNIVRAIRNTTLKLCDDCTKQFTDNKTVIMPQPQYSPDLASAEYFFFPKLKTPKTEKRFAMIEEIIDQSKQELLATPKYAFQQCFEDGKEC